MNYDQMETAELEDALEDAEGESAACGDPCCTCHDRPSEIREQIEWRKSVGDA